MKLTSDSLKNIGRIVVDDGTGELTSDSNKLIGTFRVDDGTARKTSDSRKVIGRVRVWDGNSPVIRTSDSDTLRGCVTIDDGTGILTSDSRKVRGTVILQGYGGGGGLADGATVVTWPDSSSNGHTGNHFGNPIFKKGIVGGQPVVRIRAASFDGFTLATPISGDTPWTCFAVFRTVSGSVSNVLASEAQFPFAGSIAADGTIYVGDSEGYSSTAAADIGDMSSAFHVYSMIMPVGGDYIFLDGNQKPTTPAALPNSGLTFTQIGRRLGVYGDIDIAEIILCGVDYTGDPLGYTAQNVAKTLSVKYGTPTPPVGTVIPDLGTLPYLRGWWKADSLL